MGLGLACVRERSCQRATCRMLNGRDIVSLDYNTFSEEKRLEAGGLPKNIVKWGLG